MLLKLKPWFPEKLWAKKLTECLKWWELTLREAQWLYTHVSKSLPLLETDWDDSLCFSHDVCTCTVCRAWREHSLMPSHHPVSSDIGAFSWLCWVNSHMTTIANLAVVWSCESTMWTWVCMWLQARNLQECHQTLSLSKGAQDYGEPGLVGEINCTIAQVKD